MKIFDIYPHRGYLNTDFNFESNVDQDIIIKDIVNNTSFSLKNNECKTVKLTKGQHKFICEINNVIHEETVYIEDAIKLGGSTNKDAFLFDNSPWVLMTMKDRVYFYNRDTKKEFVEQILSPDNIEFLSSNYFLFTTKKEQYSIYDIEKRCSCKFFCNLLYHTSESVVYKANDANNSNKIKIYNFISNELLEIETDNYKKNNNILYYVSIDKNRLFKVNLNTLSEEEILIKQEFKFKCFVLGHYYFAKKNNSQQEVRKEYNLIDLENENNFVFIDSRFPISKINSQTIWDYSTILKKCKDLDKDFFYSINMNICYKEINFIEIEQEIYYIEKNISNVYNGSTFEEFIEKKLCNKNSKELFNCTAFDYIGFFEDKFVFNKDHDFHYISIDGAKSSEKHYRFEVRKNKLYYFDYGNDDISYFKEYGINSRYGRIFYLSDGDDTQIPIIEEINGALKTNTLSLSRNNKIGLIIENKDVAKYSFYEGSIKKLPPFVDNIIGASKSKTHILYKEGNDILFGSYNNRDNEYVLEKIFSELFDSSKIKDSCLCDDGEHIVYLNEDNQMIYYNITTGDTQIFNDENYIERIDYNGYRSLVSLDRNRRTKLVDPITKQIIPSDYLSKYRCISPNGEYVAENRLETRYKSNIGDKYITLYDIEQLENLYDYVEPYYDKKNIEKQRNRVLFINSIFEKEDNTEKPLSNKDKQALLNKRIFSTILYKKVQLLILYKNGIKDYLEFPDIFYFLNYIAFDYNSQYMAIGGKSYGGPGIFCICNLKNKEYEIIYEDSNESKFKSILAVWVTAFNKNGDYAFYTSNPKTFIKKHNEQNMHKILDRSFLTFSPSGKYFALSQQGYIPYSKNNSSWGHQPSCSIFIHSIENPEKEIIAYQDHGDSIKGGKTKNIASVSFSLDETKLLSVSNDGVIVIRNLCL